MNLFSIKKVTSAVATTIMLFAISGCSSNKLAFEYRTFQKKTSLPCQGNCPQIKVNIPYAKGSTEASDSINKKVYLELRKIIAFEKNTNTSTDYNELLSKFIKTYEDLQKRFPDDVIEWNGDVEGNIIHQSEDLLNIKLKYYTFTGGAHGYQGFRSLLFDPMTGKTIQNTELFVNYDNFRNFAETKFRDKFKIPKNGNINATGYLFEEDRFELPQNIFFTDNGLQLYYNTYEVSAYVSGPKELLIPYSEADSFLIIK